MQEIRWFYPDTASEAVSLLREDGRVAHGGGTGLKRRGLKGYTGIVDLGRLPLDFLRQEGGLVRIGSMSTFAGIARGLRGDSVLVKSLSRAASTPLRNRITAGGSVALFPPWSDIMGPLIALDARVVCMVTDDDDCSNSPREERMEVTRYISGPAAVRRKSLIVSIEYSDDGWRSFYHREAETYFDYPAFTVTVLMKSEKDRITDARIVIAGCTGRFVRLDEAEASLRGEDIHEALREFSPDLGGVSFARKKFMEPGYLRHLAGVWVERGVKSLCRI